MSEFDLEFLTTANTKNNKYSIEGFPAKLWDIFITEARRIMPEKGELAWSSVICEFVTSFIKADIYTFILTDIPNIAKEKLDMACRQADITYDYLIASIFATAQEGLLHILRLQDKDDVDPGHTIIISGLSPSAWSKWAEMAKSIDMFPEELIGTMFEAAAIGNISIDKNTEAGGIGDYDTDYTKLQRTWMERTGRNKPTEPGGHTN